MEDNELKGLLEQHQQKMLGMVYNLKENVEDKMQIIVGYTQDIPQMKADIEEMKEKINTMEPQVAKIPAMEKKLDELDYKLDATFEKVGEMAEDVTVIKETVQDHEVRLQKVETR